MLPTSVRTERLVLRRPRRRDAPAIFDTYASDPEVARHLTWTTHATLEDTQQFLDQADRGWSTGADNPYLAWHGDQLVGSTGLTRVGRDRMRTGYLVARPLWGQGFGGEMLVGMTRLAFDLDLCGTVEALVDPENARSVHVLEKAGFKRDGEATAVHPNLSPGLRKVLRYVQVRQKIA
ncbi:MAG TPA: GNAT family N-acetyltransferase [Candidatus Thermoplasmatota archaeon]|nr:GNAT family N-acetyltransferase [Candidatus Thermoplasmatota archaeon]